MGTDELIGIGLGGASAIGQAMYGQAQAQNNQQQQVQDQKELMELGNNLAYQNWLRTNYSAQVEQMKKAGLNVGMMYGKGGGAGGTLQGSSGSASKADTIPMDISNAISQNRAIESQIKVNEAQADKLKAEADKTRGVDTDKVTTEIASLTQGINNQIAEEELTKVMKDVNIIGMEEAKERIRALGYENKINSSVINEKIKIVQNEAVKGVLENALLKTQNENVKQMTAESKARINKMTEDIAQGWGNLAVAEKQARLKEFESNLKAEYPTIGESAGRLVNELQLGLETLFGVREKRYHRNTKEQK